MPFPFFGFRQLRFYQTRKEKGASRSATRLRNAPFWLDIIIELKDGDVSIHANASDLEGADLTNGDRWEWLTHILLMFADGRFVARENLHFANGKSVRIALARCSLEFFDFVHDEDKASDADSVSSCG